MRAIAAMTFAVAGLLLVDFSAPAEVIQRGNLRVFFNGELTPKALHRHQPQPVTVRIGMRVKTTDGSEPPQLRRLRLAINRHGAIDRRGLPVCRIAQIQPSTNEDALRACGAAKVGEGRFFASVAIPGQTPFPARGRLIAFNGVENGHPVIFAHVYGENPVPTSFTIPLRIGHSKGSYGTILSASLPSVTGKAGFITGMDLTLRRSFNYRGQTRSFLTATCPLPKGLNVAPFNLMRASFGFKGKRIDSVLTRSCRARAR